MEKRNATGCSRLLWLLILLGIIAATLYYTQVIGVVPLLLVCIFVCVIGYFVDLRGYNHGYAKALGRPTAVLSREKLIY